MLNKKMIESEKPLKISNQTFSNEIDLDQYIKWNALSEIIWVDCRFEYLDLLRKVFGSCNFQNCQIVKSDLSRAQFNDSSFRNCEFLKSDLAASDFRRCELFQIKFKNSNLDLMIARSVKVSNSKQYIEIEKSFNFAKILKDMNLIISTDQDEIENS